MVIAEVPLWVIHPGSKNDGILPQSGKNGASSSATVDESNSKNDPQQAHWKERAQQSLSLLESGGGGKCAIYSVDVHPTNGTKFATGGGDGTVRIWSASSLLCKQQQQQQQNEKSKYRGSRFQPGGIYESSESEKGGSGSSSADENDDTDVHDQASSRASMEEASSTGDSTNDNVVHDLNKLVRRKKGGSTPAKAPAVAPELKDDDTKAASTAGSLSTAATEKVALLSPLSTKQLKGHKQNRLLCTLSAHTGSSVLCVRFSTNGQYLASAGDDACVCIYAQKSSPSSLASTGNLVSDHSSGSAVENWSRIKLCRGHTLDVVGLAWAPDDSHLVSCSLDSDAPIIVWKLTDLRDGNGYKNGNKKANNILCNPYKILGKNVHTSTVKGVTFDPAGTYLASSGDDPAICIWRAHDDWGLERRVDASSGIFKGWNQKEDGQEDVRELSSQTLFRRLSWSTDGAYICSTNATVKNKHVASTISREGWSVSNANSAASGAANLVGHKQPVVVCRHSPYLLDASARTKQAIGSDTMEVDKEESNNDDDDDDEPEYATLIALGDKKGFVTVWSTRKSRPIFKLQCSESKRTVTDLSWGRVPESKDLMLLVSLMDGHIVALRFGVPTELGTVLSEKDHARVFQLRYGIDLDDDDDMMGRRKIFVGDNSGPKLIENALQFTLEEQQKKYCSDDDDDDTDDDIASDAALPFSNDPTLTTTPITNNDAPSPLSIKVNQLESRSKATGKKRIRPVLMSVDGDGEVPFKKTNNDGQNGTTGITDQNSDTMKRQQKNKSSSDPMKDALESAAKAASAAEDIYAVSAKRDGQTLSSRKETESSTEHQTDTTQQEPRRQVLSAPSSIQIPHSTNRIHSVDLPMLSTAKSRVFDDFQGSIVVADCANAIKVPTGSSGQTVPCTTLSISCGGRKQWKDEIYGTSCSAIAAAETLLAVGTADGCIYLYGTSPTLGWTSGAAFRSHPPIIVGSAVVTLQLNKKKKKGAIQAKTKDQIEILIVTADGMLGVYSLVPDTALIYKGSIIPPMTHMMLSSPNEYLQPRLARVQVTECDKLLLILALHAGPLGLDDHNTRSGTRGAGAAPSTGVGGSLQAFVYNQAMELWMRVADSRFVLSDFYSTLPKTGGVHGIMSQVDDMVRSGSILSSLKPSHRGRPASDGQTSTMYNHAEEDGGSQGSKTVTRSHCEDRMACALALGSSKEFKHWLTLFVRTLAMGGFADHLRLVVDLLLGTVSTEATPETSSSPCWWLATASTILELDRRDLVKKIVISEMSKNRALQRITNEISMELNSN